MVDKGKKKQRGYMPLTERKRGREPLAQERIVLVGLKMPASLEQKFLETVAKLNAEGYRVKKSTLIRVLAEYMLPCALDVFRELEGIKDESDDDTKGAA